MDHATCFRLLSATHFAASLLPLTVRLILVLTEIGRLIVRFRRAELTPQVGHQFETQLHAQLRELGRIIVEWTLNHIEPHDRRDMPNQMCFQGVWYRRRSKTPNRKVATLFGTITLWRYLYQPLHGVEPSIFRVRPLNPILQAMLRSWHGRRGGKHGETGARRRQGAVLAAGPGTLAIKRAFRASLLRAP